MTRPVILHHLFISSGHNFFGRHGMPAGTHAAVDCDAIRCRAGRGIEGDRFFGYRPDYPGQITFFDWAVFEEAREVFHVPGLSPAAFRRNVLIEGVSLNDLIGARFELGGVLFEGVAEAKPCHWMNAVVAAGAESWLRGRGGLRARILNDGELRRGQASLQLMAGTQTAFATVGTLGSG